jgi:hypothetical protein
MDGGKQGRPWGGVLLKLGKLEIGGIGNWKLGELEIGNWGNWKLEIGKLVDNQILVQVKIKADS